MAKFTEFNDEVRAALSAPVPSSELKSKTQGGTKIVFTSDKFVMRRLDEVVGTEGWQDDYTSTTYAKPFTKVDKRGNVTTYGGSMTCHLKVLGVMKSASCDIEYLNNEDGGSSVYGSPATNAQAKAFKRAAMKFGIGKELWDKDADLKGDDDDEEESTPRRPSRTSGNAGGKTVKLSAAQEKVLTDKGFTRKDIARVGSFDIVGAAIKLSQKRKLSKGEELERDDIEDLLSQFSGGGRKRDDYEEDEDMEDED